MPNENLPQTEPTTDELIGVDLSYMEFDPWVSRPLPTQNYRAASNEAFQDAWSWEGKTTKKVEGAKVMPAPVFNKYDIVIIKDSTYNREKKNYIGNLGTIRIVNTDIIELDVLDNNGKTIDRALFRKTDLEKFNFNDKSFITVGKVHSTEGSSVLFSADSENGFYLGMPQIIKNVTIKQQLQSLLKLTDGTDMAKVKEGLTALSETIGE